MPKSAQTLTISQAAKYLGVSKDTLRRWENQGKIKPFRTLGNARRYRIENLKKIKEVKKVPSSQDFTQKTQQKIDDVTDLLSSKLDQVTQLVKSPPLPPLSSPSELSWFDKNKKFFIAGATILLVFLLTTVLSFFGLQKVLKNSFSSITNQLEAIKKALEQKTPETYLQTPGETEVSVKEGDFENLNVGNGNILMDKSGNIAFKGTLSAGYLDTSSYNLLPNSSFELNGSGPPQFYSYTDGGDQTNTFVSQDTAYDGNNCLKISPAAKLISFKPDNIPLQSGKAYTFSCYLKALNVPVTNVQIGLGEKSQTYSVEGSSTWQQIKFSRGFAESEDVSDKQFFIKVSSEKGGGALYLDACQIEEGTLTTAYKPSQTFSDGAVVMDAMSTLYPAIANTGSLGTQSKPFKTLYVNTQNITGDLAVGGNLTVAKNTTISGDTTISGNTAVSGKVSASTGVATGPQQTLRIDSSGNLTNTGTITFSANSETLTNTTNDYLISSAGFAVNNATTHYFNSSGKINAYTINLDNDLTVSGTIDANGALELGDGAEPASILAKNVSIYSEGTSATDYLSLRSKNEIRMAPSEDTDDYLYLTTSSNAPQIFWAGVDSYSNDPGIRVNATSGELEYRDEDSGSWTSLDSLSAGGVWTDGGTYLYPTSYESVRVYDSTATDYIDIAHDGTDVNITTSGTTDINIDNDLSVTGGITLTGAIGGATTITASSTITGGTLTDGTASITGGAGTGFTSLTVDNINLNSNTIAATNDSGLYLYDNASNGVFIQDAGNVGIGTTTPLEKLAVSGNATISGNLTFSGGARTIAGTQMKSLNLGNTATGNLSLVSGGNIYFDDVRTSAIPFSLVDTALNAALGQGIIDAINDAYAAAIGSGGTSGFWTLTDNLLFPKHPGIYDLAVGGTTTSSAKFHVPATTNHNAFFNLGTGNLGIGTTNPTTGKLVVNGNLDLIGGYLYDSDSNLVLNDTIDSGNINVGYGSSATLSTYDTNENLTLDPDGTGDIYFHGSTYQLSDSGDLTIGGRVTFENAAYIQNESDGTLYFNEPTLQLVGSTAIDIDSPSISLATQATNVDLINGNTAALTFESSLLRLDTSNTSVEVTGTTNLGDGGTTNYASFNATGDLAFYGTGNTITGPSGGLTITGGTGSGDDLTLVSTSDGTKGDIYFHSVSYYVNSSGQLTMNTEETINGIDINAGAVSDIDSILGNATSRFAFGGVALQNYNAISDSTTATYASSDNDLYIEGILEVGGNLYAPASGISGYWRRTEGSLAPTNITDDVNLGTIATSSALVHFTGTSGGNSWINTGNLGIGTTNPDSYKLNVKGNVGLGDDSTAADTYIDILHTDDQEARFRMESYGGGSWGGEFWLANDNSWNFNLPLDVANPDPAMTFRSTGDIEFRMDENNDETDRKIRFINNSNNELARIQENGNVGIGTTNPTEKLMVAGNVVASTDGTYNVGGYDMDTTGDGTFSGDNEGYGGSISPAGDVNGDSYQDIIIGANENPGLAGHAYIYYGGASIDTTVDVTIDAEADGDRLGTDVDTAGDVNGDGYDDVIVGAYKNDSGGTDAGRAYIFYGGASMDNTADVTMTGEGDSDYFGSRVGPAGDVNGDGYDDVIVGAPGENKAYIFYGGSSMNNTADVTLSGSGAFGIVGPAGDVNGDGYDDVIVGAYNTTNGDAYIYYGGASMNTGADVSLAGEASGDKFGTLVGSAGDVNGDGYDDVIVGAPLGASNYGRAYIYYGGVSMDNTADVTMTGEESGMYFGIIPSRNADINGDGYSDVIVSGHIYSSNSGRAHLYYGGVTMDNTADITWTGVSGYYLGYSLGSNLDVNRDGYQDLLIAEENFDRVVLYLGSGNRWKSVFADNINLRNGLQIDGLTLNRWGFNTDYLFGIDTTNWSISRVGTASFQDAAIGPGPAARVDMSGGDLLVGDDVEINGGFLYVDNIANDTGGTSKINLAYTGAEGGDSLLGNGSWLVKNDGNLGEAALMVEQSRGGDIFSASASGSPKFTIKNSGNVGIGLTNPGALLHVSAAGSPQIRFGFTGAGTGFAFKRATDTPNIQGLSTTDWSTTNSISLQADGGYVGIGTTGPAFTLDVVGVAGNNAMRLGVNAASSTTLRLDTFNDGGQEANNRNWAFRNRYNTYGLLELMRSTNSTTDPLTTVMAWDKSGNVGIGTGNPGGKLTISMGATDYGGVEILGENYSAGDNATRLRIQDTTGAVGWFVSANNDGHFAIHQGGVGDRLNIENTNGNVGIGTGNPGAKLEAAGIISTGGSYVMRAYSSGTPTAPTRSNNGEFGFAGKQGSYFRLYAEIGDNSEVYFNYAAGGDYSEYFLKQNPNDEFKFGNIVNLKNGRVNLANGNQPPLGIVSAFGSENNNTLDGERHLDNRYANIGILGQLPVMVSSDNGPIQAGDMIDYQSSINGVGAKFVSQKANYIVGKAIQSFNPNDQLCPLVSSFEAISWPQAILNDNPENLCFKLPNGTYVGKIITYLNVSWYDPDVFLTSTGDMVVNSPEGTYDGLLAGGDLESQKSKVKSQIYNVKAKTGEMVERIGNFAEIAAGKVKAGLLETQYLIAEKGIVSPVVRTENLMADVVETNLIKPVSDDLTIQIKNSKIKDQNDNAKFKIINESGEELASIDASGTAKFKDLIARKGQFDNVTMKQFNNTGNATVVGSLTVGQIDTATVSARIAKLQKVYADEIVVGKIKADEIEGLKDTISDLVAEKMTATSNQFPATSDQSDLSDLVDASLSATLLATGNWTLDTGNYLPLSSLDADSGIFNEYLAVLGQATITNLSVTNGMVVNNGMYITNNSLGSTTEKLFIQPSGLGGIDMLAGKFVIDESGDIHIAGDVYIAGKTTTKDLEVKNTATISGSLFANLIKPLGKDLAIDLTSQATQSGIRNSKLEIRNSGDVVASIDASGSAQFATLTADKLNIPFDQGADQELQFGETGQRASSIGVGTIKAGQTKVIIQAPKVTEKSLIFITATSPTYQTLAATDKVPGKTFTVSIPYKEQRDIKFNWWIIN